MNKEERIKKFKLMSSKERQLLILKKMNAKGIEVGSGVSNKKYNSIDSATEYQVKAYFR